MGLKPGSITQPLYGPPFRFMYMILRRLIIIVPRTESGIDKCYAFFLGRYCLENLENYLRGRSVTYLISHVERNKSSQKSNVTLALISHSFNRNDLVLIHQKCKWLLRTTEIMSFKTSYKIYLLNEASILYDYTNRQRVCTYIHMYIVETFHFY